MAKVATTRSDVLEREYAAGGQVLMGAAALLFAGYGVAFAAAGSRFVLRRNIT